MDEETTHVMNAGYRVGVDFTQWLDLSEAEEPEYEEVSRAWDQLMVSAKQFRVIISPLHKPGAPVEAPCDDCPE